MIKNVQPTARRDVGDIARFFSELDADRKSFVGYLMGFGCDEATILTNDYYVLRSGGLSRNAFVLIRPGAAADLLRPEDRDAVNDFRDGSPYLILARLLEPTLSPLPAEAAEVYTPLHKAHMPEAEAITKGDFRWGTVRISILGTIFDDPDSRAIAFGGDIEVFLSPRLYTVHLPTPEMLERIINAFVDRRKGVQIGTLRLTESRLNRQSPPVPIRVLPEDFVGARTALFGKPGSGRSNAAKVLADMILSSGRRTGQILFDLDGKYAYRQDGEISALHERHPDRTLRYTLRPEPQEAVRVLKANFYTDVALGHRIITELYSQQVGTPAQYELPFLNWEVLTNLDISNLERIDGAAATRYRRQLSIYLCVLHAAGFEHDPQMAVDLHLNKTVRETIALLLPEWGVREADGVIRIPRSATLDVAAPVFSKAWEIYAQGSPAFVTQSGRPYFDETAQSLLTILTQRTATGNAVSGFRKFLPFRRYHWPRSGLLLDEVLSALDEGRTVIIDLSNAARELVRFFGDLVAKAIFAHQMSKFTANMLGDHYVQFYFDEAEQLFPKTDAGPRMFYNRLAQEGAKLHIGIVYSTQRIDALNPDLLANTENFLVGHLNDQREVKALTRFFGFRDVGADVLRTTAPGFVRMISRSHKFAVPVQLRRFGAPDEPPTAPRRPAR